MSLLNDSIFNMNWVGFECSAEIRRKLELVSILRGTHMNLRWVTTKIKGSWIVTLQKLRLHQNISPTDYYIYML
jgi:hypothetical protein